VPPFYLRHTSPPPAAPTERGRGWRPDRVGLLARELFPGGEEVVHPQRRDLATAAARTRAVIASRAPAVYEAVIETGSGARAAVDILARGRRGWRLVEVKSSTSVKDEHLPDVAFQLRRSRGGAQDRGRPRFYLNPDYLGVAPSISRLFRRPSR
jgi:hypothetical protein